MNCAASIDGKLSTAGRSRVRISDGKDMERVSYARTAHDAIAVGIGTILADDPSLTGALPGKLRRSVARVVFDSKGRTPEASRVLHGTGTTYIVTTAECRRQIGKATMIRCGKKKVDMMLALDALYGKGIRSMLVEGGGEIIFELARLGLIDRMTVYTAPVLIGGRDAPTIADGDGFVSEKEFAKFRLVAVKAWGEGVLSEYERLTG